MSSGFTGPAAPTSQIIQQGIEQLRQHNATANAELTETLQDLREKVEAGYQPPSPVPNLGTPPPGTTDDFQYRRVLLYGSQWNSEVIAAAALDDTFQAEVQELARQILRDNDMLPDQTQPATQPATGDTTQSAAENAT